MSRYSDKRPHPGCRAADCQNPAKELRIRHGVLGWYCRDHARDEPATPRVLPDGRQGT